MLLLSGLLLHSYAVPTGTLRGQVFDSETNKPLPGARLSLDGQTFYASEIGSFSLPDLPVGTYSLDVQVLGYELATVPVSIAPGETAWLAIALKVRAIQIPEITIAGQRSMQENLRSIGALDIQLRPLNSSQDALRAVPGLFIAQHAGGGKAEQIFLRGFDIDHGTDINLTVDGMPVNMVSHAHGQGYADLHFLMPELIERIDFDKGPYDARTGNLATAGQVAFRTREVLDRSEVKLQVGQFDTYQGTALVDLLPGNTRHHAYVAGSYLYSDGYFDSPQNFDRLNVMASYAGMVGDATRLRVSLSHFDSQWDASGQIPDRAVAQGLIGPLGAIDSTEGGHTSRSNVQVALTQLRPDGTVLRQTLYYSRYTFELYSNFTFFLEDPVNGDQIRQREIRDIYGYRSSATRDYRWGKVALRTEAGLDLRIDEVRDNELSATTNRTTVRERLALGQVNEANAGFFLIQQIRPADRLSIEASLRYDQFRFAYEDHLTEAYDPRAVSQGILSPKLNVLLSLSRQVQLYARAGRGFHSNDTRVILAEQGREILPSADGADLGLMLKPLPGMIVQAGVWGLWMEQEFVYVGDAAIVEPGGRTRRQGVDVSVRYQAAPWLYFDADVNYTHARGVEPGEPETYIPLGPVWTSIGGATLRLPLGLDASLRYRHLGDRPANEDYSLTATGYTLLDAVLRYRTPAFEVSLSVENLLDAAWKEAQFETESRLRDEAEPVSEIHFTPGTPRFARLSVGYFF
ncbi:MAG: TonB-dependent receptor [Bacteroidia bacterium]